MSTCLITPHCNTLQRPATHICACWRVMSSCNACNYYILWIDAYHLRMAMCHVTPRCNTLQHSATHIRAYQRVKSSRNCCSEAAFLKKRTIIRACQRVKAHHAATRCIKLPHTFAHTNVLTHTTLQHAASNCNTHSRIPTCWRHTTLQHTASNCNTLQHTFAHANVSRQATTLVEPPGALVDRFVHHFGLDRISQKSALLWFPTVTWAAKCHLRMSFVLAGIF